MDRVVPESTIADFPGESCDDTKTTLTVLIAITAIAIVLRWVCKQCKRNKQGEKQTARGKHFLEFVRTEKIFVDPDSISVPTFPDEESARVRPLQSGSKDESLKSTWSYVIYPLFCRAGGVLTPLLFALACGTPLAITVRLCTLLVEVLHDPQRPAMSECLSGE